MQMYGNYVSPLGYQNGDNGIDSYGVNHSGFNTRDELAYQLARQKRENQLMQNYNDQGITENYPQYGTNFWGNNAVNNYGFGNSNIENNIANLPQVTPLPQVSVAPQPQPQDDILDKIKQLGQTIADTTQAGVVGYATGASLGNYDEAMGGASTIFGTDYKHARDAVRQMQNNLSQQHPYIYKGMEMLGAATTPMHLLNDTNKLNRFINALTDTVNASVGYAENWNDFGVNLGINGVGNGIGFYINQSPVGRVLGNVGRKIIPQSINYLADNIKNMIYSKDK